MTRFDVDFGLPIKGYSSPEAAIAAAKQHPMQQQARSDGMRLAGQRCVSGRCGQARWCLEFTGPLWLDIACRNGGVEWSAVEHAPAVDSIPGSISFRWPSGAMSVVDPERLFADRAGAEFWQLWVNEIGFYVYLRRHRILWFRAVQRIDADDEVLYVCEDD